MSDRPQESQVVHNPEPTTERGKRRRKRKNEDGQDYHPSKYNNNPEQRGKR